jgi:carbonic anhydrase
MRKLSFVLLLSNFLLIQPVLADGEWGYTGQFDEQNWGSLGYPVCGEGKQQSPINITNASDETITDPISYHHGVTKFRMMLDSHNLYAFTTDENANTMQFNGDTYKLESFNFHTPGEHQIDGKRYVLEGHFIHENSAGRPVVLGVFFKLGAPNPEFAKFLQGAHDKNVMLSVSGFLTQVKSYYTYEGSLTAPTCAEGLTWVVFEKPLEISASQLKYFQTHVIPDNSRSPQPLNDRLVAFHR